MFRPISIIRRLRRRVVRVVRFGYARWRLGCRRFLRQPPERHLVICGFPRGGTSLLYNMLATSLPDFRAESFEVSAQDVLRKTGNRVSKLPLDVLNLSKLPACNIYRKRIDAIIVVRDVRDVITSVHPNVPDRYFCDYDGRWSPRGTRPPYEVVRVDTGVKAIFEAIQSAPNGLDSLGLHVHTVRYEELVADPDGAQSRLGEELGLTFRYCFSDFHHRKESHPYDYNRMRPPADPSLVRENLPVDRTRLGKWRSEEHRPRIVQQFSEHPELFEVLRELRYEPDDAWFEAYVSAAD